MLSCDHRKMLRNKSNAFISITLSVITIISIAISHSIQYPGSLNSPLTYFGYPKRQLRDLKKEIYLLLIKQLFLSLAITDRGVIKNLSNI